MSLCFLAPKTPTRKYVSSNINTTFDLVQCHKRKMEENFAVAGWNLLFYEDKWLIWLTKQPFLC